MRAPVRYALLIFMLSRSVMLFAAQEERPKEESPKAEAQEESDARNRAGENLLGQADTSKGEARRNENVQINLLDTNAVRELRIRRTTGGHSASCSGWDSES